MPVARKPSPPYRPSARQKLRSQRRAAAREAGVADPTTARRTTLRRSASIAATRRLRAKHGSPKRGGGWADFARRTGLQENYTPRVLDGEFQPTAAKARRIAAARGVSLHQFAYELGIARSAPPAIRQPLTRESLLDYLHPPGVKSRLATDTGYSLPDVSRFFARQHPPTLRKLMRFAEAMGVWADDLLAALGWGPPAATAATSTASTL